jgi:hypothetical protein
MVNYICLKEIKYNNNKLYNFDIIEKIEIPINDNVLLYSICLNPIKVKNDITNIFEKKYKFIKNNDEILFEGNFYSMINDINNINKVLSDIDEDINNSEHQYYGGNKNLFKVVYENNNYIVKCIEGDILIKNNVHIEKIINNKVIELNKIYDFNNKKLVDNIYNFATNIDIENIDILKNNILYNINKDYNFKNIFSNYIINNYIIPYSNNNEIWNNIEIKVFNINNEKKIEIIKVNNKYYELNNFKNYVGYIIVYNIIDKTYFMIDNNYNSIGEDHENIYTEFNNERENLYKYDEQPWTSEDNFLKYINKLNNIINNNNLLKCTNIYKPLFI